jgi:sulfite reductase (NADPH) flavoprotein alpha-component
MTISIWRYSHLTLAFTSAIFIIIASITGVILSIEPISEKLNPYKIEGVDTIYLAETIEVLKQNYEEVIQLKTDYNEFVSINAISKEGEFLNGYINPITGEYLGPEIEKNAFYNFITNLHRSLFLKGIGRFFVGLSSFLLFLISITGILLIVKRQGGSKKIFSKIVYENFIQYYHIVIGRFTLIPILIITLTGVYLSLFRFDFFDLEKTKSHQINSEIIVKDILIDSKDFQVFKSTKLIDISALEFPFSDAIEDNYTLKLKSKEVLINQYSGKIVSTKEFGFNTIIKSLNVNLHTGKGSVIWSIILFVSCINILFFIYSGLTMTIKRQRNKLQNKYRSDKSKYVVLVGSENGNTIAYANAFYKQLIGKGEQVYITELNNYKFFKKCEHLIIITSTYGLGEAPVNANKFLKLIESEQQNSNISYSIVGFGSKLYPNFCKFAIDISKVLKETNITPLIKPFYIDSRSFTVFSEWFHLWSDQTGIDINITENDIINNSNKS